MRLLTTTGTVLALMALAATGPRALADNDSKTKKVAAPAVKRDDSASEKLGIKLALQCWTFNKLSFFETIDKARELGVKYIEIYPGQRLKPGSNEKIHRTMSDAVIAEVTQKLDEAGMKLVAYGVDGIPTDEAGARKTFEWAKRMGIKVLVTETTPTDLFDRLANEYQVKVALHNHPASWPPDAVLKACEGKSKMIGSCSDTGHWQTNKWVPVEMLRKLQGRVLHSHFKDRNELGRGHDVPWGSGKGDARGMLEELKQQGYQGYVSIEYEYGSLEDLARTLPKCVEFFDKTMTEIAR
jgi:sugar phosphate isomerase/epimerase